MSENIKISLIEKILSHFYRKRGRSMERNLSNYQKKLIDNSNSTWNIERTKAWQYKKLARGKTEAPRVTERIVLKYNGWKDGRNGFPKADHDGRWSSPRVKQEIDAYEEFCSKVWGSLQIDMERMHQEVEYLIRSIIGMERSLARLKGNPPTEKEDEDTDHHVIRRAGEEELTDDQVRNRRKREREKETAPYFSQIRELEARIQNAYCELNEITSYIVEASNAVRLISERTMNHTRQRIDIYWNAAIRNSKNKEEIPISVDVFLPSESEKTYMSQHKYVFDKAQKMITRYQTDHDTNGEER